MQRWRRLKPTQNSLRRLETSALSLLIVLLCRIIFSSMHTDHARRCLARHWCVFLARKKRKNARSFHDLFTIDFVVFSFLFFSSTIEIYRADPRVSQAISLCNKNERTSLKTRCLSVPFISFFIFSGPPLYHSSFRSLFRLTVLTLG